MHGHDQWSLHMLQALLMNLDAFADGYAGILPLQDW
jgi:hypothetical protein